LRSHNTQRSDGFLRRAGVLRGFADREHPTDADDDAPRLLRERRALGVEEAERLLRPQRTEERVEHSKLVLAFLDPRGLDLLAAPFADVRLAVGHPAELQALCDPDIAVPRASLDVFAQHPAKRHASRRVLRPDEARRREVPVRLRVDIRVRVRHRSREREGRHERHPFPNAGREVTGVELVEALPGATDLDLVAAALADAREDEAARVVEWARADASGPAAVVRRARGRGS